METLKTVWICQESLKKSGYQNIYVIWQQKVLWIIRQEYDVSFLKFQEKIFINLRNGKRRSCCWFLKTLLWIVPSLKRGFHVFFFEQVLVLEIMKGVVQKTKIWPRDQMAFTQAKIWELIFLIFLWRTFCPHLGNFCVGSSFGQISPLAFFRWFTATSDRNAESCNRNPSNYCLRNVVKEETTQKLPR